MLQKNNIRLNTGPGRLPEDEYVDQRHLYQLRTICREDGIEVPLLIKAKRIQDPGEKDIFAYENVELLSDSKAQEERLKIKDYRDAETMYKRLQDEFGLDREFLEEAGLSIDDLQSMIFSHDEIQLLEDAKPDHHVLDKLRSKYAKALLPAATVLRTFRPEQKAVDAYRSELSHLLEQTGESEDFLEQEQLYRLSALNKQARARRRVTKTNAVAASTGVTTIGTGTGYVVGVMLENSLGVPAITPIATTSIGLASAVSMSYQRLKDLKRRVPKMLYDDPSSQYEPLHEQLKSEADLAHRFDSATKNYYHR